MNTEIVARGPARRVCPHCFAVYRAGFTSCAVDGEQLEPFVEDLLIGVMLSGRYVVQELIGEGATGRVYRARHALMSRDFAVKVMFGDLSANETTRERFLREAQTVSRLAHGNIVSVVDFGATKAGLLYMVMTYVEGRTLQRLVEDEGPLPEARVRRHAIDLLSALHHAHENGVVHRDVKPENVVAVQYGGRDVVRVLDFGVAFMVAPGTEERERLTRTGCIVGTPLFMPPEQAFGRSVDRSADIYSAGMVLYYLLAGTTAFDARSMTMAQLLMKEKVPPISTRAPGIVVSAELEAMIAHMTAHDVEHRMASAAEALAILEPPIGEIVTRDLERDEAHLAAEVPSRWPFVAGGLAFVVAALVLILALL